MIPFNYHHLYYFYTVCREGSVTRAAKTLRIGQPALSSQLKTFEGALGVKLFERHGRMLRSSEEGREILAYAEDIFETGRQMMRALSGGDRKGLLRTRIGLTAYVPKTIAERLIRLLFAIEPDLRLDAVEDRMDNLLPRLAAHELDFVLADELPSAEPAGLGTHLLDRVPVAFAAVKALAGRYRRVPADLDGAPMILPTSNSRLYADLRDYFAAHKIRPRVIAEVQDVEIVRRMALAGLGIAPMNVYTLRNAPGHEGLIQLNRSPLPVRRSVYLFTMSRRRPHPMLNVILKKFRVQGPDDAQRS